MPAKLVQQIAHILAEANELVCGLGIIGQYALQAALLKGAIVSVTDVVESRLATARALGAHHSIHGKNENLAVRAQEIAPDGFDIIIDTSSVA